MSLALVNRESCDEGELLRNYRQGDADSFAEIYRRFSAPLLLYAHSLTRDGALAEDLVQEAFAKLLGLDPPSLRDTLRAFLYAIVRNLARDWSRRARLREKSFPVLTPRAEPADVDAEMLSRALDRLPDEQRETVILKVYGEMTFDEIAALAGEPPGTVMSRYRYGLQKLAELLEEKP